MSPNTSSWRVQHGWLPLDVVKAWCPSPARRGSVVLAHHCGPSTSPQQPDTPSPICECRGCLTRGVQVPKPMAGGEGISRWGFHLLTPENETTKTHVLFLRLFLPLQGFLLLANEFGLAILFSNSILLFFFFSMARETAALAFVSAVLNLEVNFMNW